MIRFQDELWLVIHGTVAGSDDVNGIVLYFLQVLLDVGAEGHHDFRIIPLGCLIDLPFIGDIQVSGG